MVPWTIHLGLMGLSSYEGGKGNDGFRDLAIQSDGKMVVTGYTSTDEGFELLTARYDAAGILDNSFGHGRNRPI